MELETCTSGPINAERYVQLLEQHLLPSRRRFLQGRPSIFQQDEVKPHPASVPTAWLRSRRPRTAEQLESSIRQEWDDVPLPEVQQLVSSAPDVYRCC